MRKDAVVVLSGLSRVQAERVELLLLAMALDVEIVERGARSFAVTVAAGDADHAAGLIREEFPYGVPGSAENEDRAVRDGPDTPPDMWFGRGTAAVIFLLLACVLVFVSLAVDGGPSRGKLLEHGAISWALVEEGQYWRLMSAVFGNMAVLLLLAPPLAHALGPARFVLVFLVAGLSGNVLSHELAPVVGLKAGASGAIAGLLGGLAGSALRPGRASRFRSWQVLGALAAVYGMVVGFGPGRDNVAHLGGLLAGFVLGRVIEPEPFDGASLAPLSASREPPRRLP